MRGGLGTRRILRVQEGAEVTCNALFDRTKEGFGAFGLDGGGKGGRGAILVKRKGESEFRTFKEVFGTVSPSKFTNIVLTGGDEVRIDSPGGGGYGDARERERDRVERDIFEGFITEAQATRRLRLERRGMTLHAPQLITAARMLYAVWLPADPAAAAALVPDELTAREGAPVFINQYVVDDAAQTSSAGAPRGLRRVLADLPGRRPRRSRHRGRARRGAGGRTTSTPRRAMIAYALARGVPATSGRTELELSGGRLVATTWGEGGQELIRTTARVEIGTPFTGNGQLRYITRVGGELVSGRYPFVMQRRRDVRGRVGRVPRRVAPRLRAAAGRSADDHVRLLLARDLVLLPRRRGPARQRGRQLMGVWREQNPAVWETVVTPCDCCGQVVAKRLWIVEIDGREQRFCSPECEELFREYVLPRRAAAG